MASLIEYADELALIFSFLMLVISIWAVGFTWGLLKNLKNRPGSKLTHAVLVLQTGFLASQVLIVVILVLFSTAPDSTRSIRALLALCIQVTQVVATLIFIRYTKRID